MQELKLIYHGIKKKREIEINFKLDRNKSQSELILKRIEYHILPNI